MSILGKFMKLHRILVVGGRGFIGLNLMEHLPQADILDLKDGQDWLEVDFYKKYETIVFLAVDMGQTKKAYKYNEELYMALDDYMFNYPDTQVIYTSSAAIYPDSMKPSSEKTLPSPNGWYGKSKMLGELYVQQYRNHTILRLSNVYGYGGKGAWDLFLRGHNEIYGDGSQIRDYVAVRYVCDSIVGAIKYPDKWRGVTNVSRGRGTTTLELLNAFNTKKPVFKPARKGDVQCSILCKDKMEELMWGR
jgi:nucleoside-diphosphate-sugar epimerase